MEPCRELVAALEHLAEAKSHVERIVAASSDWTAKEQIDAEFESLEEACRVLVGAIDG